MTLAAELNVDEQLTDLAEDLDAEKEEQETDYGLYLRLFRENLPNLTEHVEPQDPLVVQAIRLFWGQEQFGGLYGSENVDHASIVLTGGIGFHGPGRDKRIMPGLAVWSVYPKRPKQIIIIPQLTPGMLKDGLLLLRKKNDPGILTFSAIADALERQMIAVHKGEKCYMIIDNEAEESNKELVDEIRAMGDSPNLKIKDTKDGLLLITDWNNFVNKSSAYRHLELQRPAVMLFGKRAEKYDGISGGLNIRDEDIEIDEHDNLLIKGVTPRTIFGFLQGQSVDSHARIERLHSGFLYQVMEMQNGWRGVATEAILHMMKTPMQVLFMWNKLFMNAISPEVAPKELFQDDNIPDRETWTKIRTWWKHISSLRESGMRMMAHQLILEKSIGFLKLVSKIVKPLPYKFGEEFHEAVTLMNMAFNDRIHIMVHYDIEKVKKMCSIGVPGFNYFILYNIVDNILKTYPKELEKKQGIPKLVISLTEEKIKDKKYAKPRFIDNGFGFEDSVKLQLNNPNIAEVDSEKKASGRGSKIARTQLALTFPDLEETYITKNVQDSPDAQKGETGGDVSAYFELIDPSLVPQPE